MMTVSTVHRYSYNPFTLFLQRYLVVAAVLMVFSAYGFAGGKAQKTPPASDSSQAAQIDGGNTYPIGANQVIAGGLSLSLPPGWHASSDASGESDWILLCRSADSRSILRVMEITTGYNLSGPKLAAYYAANYLKDQVLLENASVSVGGNAFHVFISQSPSSGTVLSAFLLDRPGQVVFFEEISPLGPSDARKDFLAILGSCRRRPVGESGRRIAGLLDFFSMDGSWVWLYDEKDGIRVAGRLGEDVVTIAVLRVVDGNDPLAKASAGTADAIQATLLISDSATPVQVRDIASKELRSLWIDMAPSGIPFQAVLEPVGATDTVETVLESVELKKLFSRDLVLGGL